MRTRKRPAGSDRHKTFAIRVRLVPGPEIQPVIAIRNAIQTAKSGSREAGVAACEIRTRNGDGDELSTIRDRRSGSPFVGSRTIGTEGAWPAGNGRAVRAGSVNPDATCRRIAAIGRQVARHHCVREDRLRGKKARSQCCGANSGGVRRTHSSGRRKSRTGGFLRVSGRIARRP